MKTHPSKMTPDERLKELNYILGYSSESPIFKYMRKHRTEAVCAYKKLFTAQVKGEATFNPAALFELLQAVGSECEAAFSAWQEKEKVK